MHTRIEEPVQQTPATAVQEPMEAFREALLKKVILDIQSFEQAMKRARERSRS